MTQQKLPNTGLIYITALLSCIFFIFGGFAIVLSVTSLFLANKSEQVYQQNPTIYSNFGKIKKSKIVAIVGLVLNLIILGITVWTLYTIGWDAWSDEFMRKWNEGLQNSRR